MLAVGMHRHFQPLKVIQLLLDGDLEPKEQTNSEHEVTVVIVVVCCCCVRLHTLSARVSLVHGRSPERSYSVVGHVSTMSTYESNLRMPFFFSSFTDDR